MVRFDYEQYKRDILEDQVPPASFPEGTPKGAGQKLPIKAYHHMRYELSEEITEWISDKARAAGISDSRYLSKILTEMMNKEKEEVEEEAPAALKDVIKVKPTANEVKRELMKNKKAMREHNKSVKNTDSKSKNCNDYEDIGMW